MSIGTRKQIQLVQITAAKGAEGNWNSEAKTTYNTWAEVTDPRGFRSYDNGQTNLQKTKNFKVRFRFDKFPGADWKVRYDDKDWTISAINKEDEKRFYWNITATAP